MIIISDPGDEQEPIYEGTLMFKGKRAWYDYQKVLDLKKYTKERERAYRHFCLFGYVEIETKEKE